MSDIFQRIPFLRVLLPLIAGIYLSDRFRVAENAVKDDFMGIELYGLILLGLFSLACVFFCLRRDSVQTSGRLCGCFVILFLFVWGMFRSYEDRQSDTLTYSESEQVYTFLLITPPEKKARSVQCEGLLLYENGARSEESRHLLLNIRRDSLSETLSLGDGIVCRAVISKPENRGNPGEFDYAGYLLRQGISGQLFLWGSPWQKLSRCELVDLPLRWTEKIRLKALMWREQLIGQYEQAGLSGEELSLYSALTLGDQSDMPSSLKQMYSAAGVSHILALSGMHLCYLVALFNFFLIRYEHRPKVHFPVCLAALLLVWGYCLMVGFPSSLVRAAIMYSLMWSGRMIGRKGFSVNSLAASAFVMLSIKPDWLFDIGFLLSCLAMCGILVWMPRFFSGISIQNRLLKIIVESLAVSFCAQLPTVPLVAYVFHSVSLYSAFVTLLLTPVTAVLIYMMPFLWLSRVVLPAISVWLADILSLLIRFQHQVLQIVVDWPGAVLQCDPDILVVCLLYGILLLWLCRPAFTFVRWVRSNVLLLVLLLVAVGCSYIRQRNLEPSLVFYYNTSCPSVHLISSSDRSYLVPAYADSVASHMKYIADSFWKHELELYPFVVGSHYDDGYVSCFRGLVYCPDVSFVVLSDDRWDSVRPASPLKVDYLYVCRGYYGKLDVLKNVFQPKLVVLDASLSRKQNARLAAECRGLDWPFYDMRLSGALKVPLK